MSLIEHGQTNDMRLLREGAEVSGVQAVHAEVHLLWGATDSEDWSFKDSGIRVLGTEEGGVVRLGCVRPFGGGDPAPGQRSNGAWPGAIYGVRAPYPQETPLSWGEVNHARKEGLL